MNVLVLSIVLSAMGICFFLVVYPLVIFLIARVRPNPWKIGENYPEISVIIPTHGVSGTIEKKIWNTVRQYPTERMEILVVYSEPSDCFRASKLHNTFKDLGVRVITEESRTGKANAINLALRRCKGEICVITDSDSFLEENALKHLMHPFVDDHVGAVSGNLVYGGSNLTDTSHTIIFSKFKGGLKRYEGLLDSCSYAPGELLAFRKTLITELPPDSLCDDYYILLKIRSKGYRCVEETGVTVYETPPQTMRGKLKRIRRVTAGTLLEARRHRFMFFNPTFGMFGLLIFPFYILRILLLPFFLVLFLGSLALVLSFLFPLELLIVSGILVGMSALKAGRTVLAPVFYGVLLIAGLFLGLVDWIKGDLSPIWEECKK